MKKIGLIGAMDEEVAIIKEEMTKYKRSDKSRHDFCGRRFLRNQNRCRCKWHWQG